MPYRVSGDLRIVVSADLGEFGPTDGKPVLYHFSPLYHVQGLIPWLLLPLAFVSLRENRTAQAAWILAPVALLAAILWAAASIMRLPSGSAVQMNAFFAIIVVGFSLIWLFADRIGHHSRLVTLLLATLVYLGFLGVNLLTGEFGKDAMTVASMAAASILPIMLAFAVASFVSSRSFRKVRFVSILAVALFCSFLASLSLMTVLFFRAGPIQDQIVEVALASLIFSLVSLLGLTPFLVLLWTNRFWRRRFECVTGIRPDASEGSRVG